MSKLLLALCLFSSNAFAQQYAQWPVPPAGGGGITSINGDTTPAQTITAGTGISVSTSGGDTVITNTGGSGDTAPFFYADTTDFVDGSGNVYYDLAGSPLLVDNAGNLYTAGGSIISTSTAGGTGALALANGSSATGTNAFASGNGANATADYTTAVGPGTTSNATYGFAGGYGATVGIGANGGTAIGVSSQANGVTSFAGGNGATAGGTDSIAIGDTALADTNYTTVIGSNSHAATSGSAVFGDSVTDVNAPGGVTLGTLNANVGNGENWLGILPGATANIPRMIFPAATVTDDGTSAFQLFGNMSTQGGGSISAGGGFLVGSVTAIDSSNNIYYPNGTSVAIGTSASANTIFYGDGVTALAGAAGPGSNVLWHPNGHELAAGNDLNYPTGYPLADSNYKLYYPGTPGGLLATQNNLYTSVGSLLATGFTAGTNSLALQSSQATADTSFVAGYGALADTGAISSVVLGPAATASSGAQISVVIGNASQVDSGSISGLAIGNTAYAIGDSPFALGDGANVAADFAFGLGDGASVTSGSTGGMALGGEASSAAPYATMIASSPSAGVTNSVANSLALGGYNGTTGNTWMLLQDNVISFPVAPLATNGSGVGTITNLPAGKSGNPTGYLQVTINGTVRDIPFW